MYYFDECCHGLQDAEWHLTKEVKDIYPDFVKMAESFSVPAKRVLRPDELRPAIRFCPANMLHMWTCHLRLYYGSMGTLCCVCVI